MTNNSLPPFSAIKNSPSFMGADEDKRRKIVSGYFNRASTLYADQPESLAKLQSYREKIEGKMFGFVPGEPVPGTPKTRLENRFKRDPLTADLEKEIGGIRESGKLFKEAVLSNAGDFSSEQREGVIKSREEKDNQRISELTKDRDDRITRKKDVIKRATDIILKKDEALDKAGSFLANESDTQQFVPESVLSAKIAFNKETEGIIGELPEEQRQFVREDLHAIKSLRDGADAVRTSDGTITVNPKLMWDTEGAYTAISEASKSADEIKDAKEELALIRKKPEIYQPMMRFIGRNDDGFKDWANKWEKKNGFNPPEMIESYLAENSGFFDRVGAGLSQGGDQILKQTIGFTFGITGSEKLEEGLNAISDDIEAQQMVSSAVQELENADGITIEDVSAGVTSMVPALATGGAAALVKKGAGLTGAVTGAGIQSAGGTAGDAYKRVLERNMDALGDSPTPEQIEDARSDALSQARWHGLGAGLITAGVTALGGTTGVEAIFKKKLSNITTAEITALKSQLQKDALIQGAKNLGINTGSEFLEEYADEAINGVLSIMTTNPEMTLQEAFDGALKAGVIGAIAGGGIPAVQSATGGAINVSKEGIVSARNSIKDYFDKKREDNGNGDISKAAKDNGNGSFSMEFETMEEAESFVADNFDSIESSIISQADGSKVINVIFKPNLDANKKREDNTGEQETEGEATEESSPENTATAEDAEVSSESVSEEEADGGIPVKDEALPQEIESDEFVEESAQEDLQSELQEEVSPLLYRDNKDGTFTREFETSEDVDKFIKDNKNPTKDEVYDPKVDAENALRESGVMGSPQGSPQNSFIRSTQSVEQVGDAKQTPATRVIKALSNVAKESGSLASIRTGNLTLRNAAGEYDTKADVARVRVANDIPVAAHEVAHAMERVIFGDTNPWENNKHKSELLKLGKALYPDKVPTGGHLSEGFAEFFRLYITEPATIKKEAPGFTKHFEEWISKSPNINKVVRPSGR